MVVPRVQLSSIAFLVLVGPIAALGQAFSPATSSSSGATPVGPVAPITVSPLVEPILKASHCDPGQVQEPAQLSFRQRACYSETRLVAPSMVFRAALSGTYGQWRNIDPYVRHENMDDFGRRFAGFYARHAAQNGAELLAGYVNHEDPRFHPSMQHGVWNRTRSALLSVLTTKDADGVSRPALAPIAGSFGAGFVGMALSERHDRLQDGFRRTGLSYGGYFGTALMREFHPDLALLASHILHKKKQDQD